VTIIASFNTLAGSPYPTPDDSEFYRQQEHDEADDIIKSKALLKQLLLISAELFDEVFNVTFFPSQKKYTIAYGTHIVAEVKNFDCNTSKHHHKEDYSLQIFEDINSKVDPTFLVSICIMIDYIEWPHYLSRT
jgi:hypothetical protein